MAAGVPVAQALHDGSPTAAYRAAYGLLPIE